MKVCDCGKIANETGYCDLCEKRIKEQIEREIHEDEIAIKSDYMEDFKHEY